MYWQERGPRPGRPCDTSIRVLTFERHEFHVDVLPVSEGSQTQIFLVRRFDVRPGRFLRARSTQCRVQGVAVASLTPSHSGREKDRAWGRGWKWQQLTWPRPHIPHASSHTYRLLLVVSIAKVTGERTWEPWFQHESRTTPGRWSCGTGPCLLLYVSICHVLMFPVSRSPFVWICILFYSFLYVHHPLWKFLSGSTTSMLWQGIRSGNRPRGDGKKWCRQGNRRFDFAWKPFGILSFKISRSAGGLQNSQGLHHRHPRLHQPWAPVSKQRHRETPGSHVTMFLKNIHKFDGRNPAPPYCSYATDENGKIIHIKWYRLPSINSITSNHLL